MSEAPPPDPPQCNLCGGTSFGDQGNRVGVRCLGCNSFERTRMMWLALSGLGLDPGRKCLHIAPDTGLVPRLRAMLDPGNYTTADLFPELYAKVDPDCRRIDLCDMQAWPDRSYDYIIHSHVLEHTPCTLAYTLYHLHRMLTDTGRHIFVVPFLGGRYDEAFGDMPLPERMRRFGQDDHVRRIGLADMDSHLGAILRLPAVYDAESQFGAKALRRANIPQPLWHGYTGSSVIILRKTDFKLGGF